MGRYRVKRMWTVMGQGSRGLMNDCFSKTGEEDNICRYVSSYETGFYCQTRMLWMESVSILLGLLLISSLFGAISVSANGRVAAFLNWIRMFVYDFIYDEEWNEMTSTTLRILLSQSLRSGRNNRVVLQV